MRNRKAISEKRRQLAVGKARRLASSKSWREYEALLESARRAAIAAEEAKIAEMATRAAEIWKTCTTCEAAHKGPPCPAEIACLADGSTYTHRPPPPGVSVPIRVECPECHYECCAACGRAAWCQCL